MSSKSKATAMKSDSKPALTPKLRFPEFRDAAEWEEKSLAQICDRITNGKANAQDHEEDGEYPLFDRSAVIKRSNDFMFDGEAVILPGEGMRFVPKIFRGKFNLHQRAYALMEHQGDARFVYHSLDYLQDSLAKKAVKSTVLSLRLPIVENFEIGYPKPPEQEKIADCLTSVDELIAAQARKVDALKSHKKGLMQQLFPREGKTQPSLRFPEFRDAGEWEQETVEEIISTITPPKKLQTADYQPAGEFPIVDQSQNYICGWTNDSEGVIEEGLPVIVFGDHTCALKFIDHPFVQGADGIKIFKPKRAIDVRFLFCALEANPVVPESYKRHFSMLKEKTLSFPDPKSGEQQRIADCLTSLDDYIAAQIQNLDALRTHKKGLMQQLFPDRK
ncbi:MAG: restriction endonuclease subunit S, partial [Amphiplicatus sp.]